MSVFLRYILIHHGKQALLLSILGLLSSLTSVIMSFTLKYSVDVLFSVENSQGPIALLLFLLMAVTTYLSDQIGENYLVTKYQAEFVHGLKRSLIDSYLSLPYSEAREYDMGELMNRDDVAAELGDLYVSVVYNLPYCVLEDGYRFTNSGSIRLAAEDGHERNAKDKRRDQQEKGDEP